MLKTSQPIIPVLPNNKQLGPTVYRYLGNNHVALVKRIIKRTNPVNRPIVNYVCRSARVNNVSQIYLLISHNLTCLFVVHMMPWSSSRPLADNRDGWIMRRIEPGPRLPPLVFLFFSVDGLPSLLITFFFWPALCHYYPQLAPSHGHIVIGNGFVPKLYSTVAFCVKRIIMDDYIALRLKTPYHIFWI